MMLRTMVFSILFCALVLPAWQAAAAQFSSSRVPTPDEHEAQAKTDADKRQLSKLAGADPASVANAIPPQVTEQCLAQVMRPDNTFNVQSIPLANWLAASGDVTQIPWKIHVANPEFRVDQRYEVAYSAAIKEKDLAARPGPNDVVFLSGVKTPAGDILPAKPVRQAFRTGVLGESKLDFRDCIFFRPGEYVLWMVLYDRGSGKHNVSKHRIRIPAAPNDPSSIPNVNLPGAEFPLAFGYDPGDPETPPAKLSLPVMNVLPVRIELVAVSSASDQWIHRPDILRWTQNRVLAATGVLAQMRPAHGSIDTVALNLNSQSVPFEQAHIAQLDWTTLAKVFLTDRGAAQSAAVSDLTRASERPSFFREFIGRELRFGDTARVVILISGTTAFPQGADLSSLKLDANCRCSLYHLRFQVNKDDVFDDLGRIIQSPKTRTFNITSAHDITKAVAEIVHELEASR